MIKDSSLFATEGTTRSDRCLHTPSAFARQNLLYVQEVGRLRSLEPHRCVRENVDSYLFLLVLDGRGSLVIKGRAYQVAAGDCALIDCREHYEHISDEEDAWKLAWVHFNGHGARGYYELFLKNHPEGNVFTVRDAGAWEEMLDGLLSRQKDRSFQAELSCGELLLHLMNRVIGSVSDTGTPQSGQEKGLANRMRELLNEKYADGDVLGELEEAFGEDSRSLGERFERQFGISIEEYVSSRRLNAAKELLRFSIKSVSQIAEESGIGDMIVMQQMFRENEGMTAEEYRAKWAQWIR